MPLVNVFGGVERELQIVVNPERLAKFRLTIPEVVSRLRAESISLSAGDVDEGKRRYVVRAEGELNTVEAVQAPWWCAPALRCGASPASDDTLGRVFVRDVAEVRFGYKEPTARIRHKGEPAIADQRRARERRQRDRDDGGHPHRALRAASAGPLETRGPDHRAGL